MRTMIDPTNHASTTVPADLLHSHASALHYAGFTPVEAANRLGHGVGLHWRHYAHVIESMSGTRYDGLDALIASARADLMFARSSPARSHVE